MLIAILREINYPQLIDKILLLNHELILPSCVYAEILDDVTLSACKMLISDKKIKISTINTSKEVEDFRKSFPYLGKGEADSMLLFKKLSRAGHRNYCILDDGRARKTAKSLEIKFTGLLGLLCIMKDRQILSEHEFANIIEKLRKSNFRLPM